MASTETGAMFTQEQVDKMTDHEKEHLVHLTPEQEKSFSSLTPEQRVEALAPPKPRKVRGAWHNPVFTKVTKTAEQRKKDNKIERQRRKAGRK